MNLLILATAVFLLAHLGLSSTPLRGALLRVVGEGPYRGLYSLLALAAIVWMSWAYTEAPFVPLWEVGPELLAVPLVVMPFALLGAVCGVSQPNPSAAGPPVPIDRAEPARGLLRVTRHPLLTGIALWAAAHIAAKGDVASLVFFGGLLLLAVAGAPLMERRKRAERGADWQDLAAATSIVPFAAILSGRNRLVLGEIGWLRFGVALWLYVMLLWLHPYLFGVPVW